MSKNSARIEELLKARNSDNELRIKSEHGILRIDLKDDNIALWKDTYNRYNKNYNLLLACESSKGNISETRLTWVVGSAIRPIFANSPAEAGKILRDLGINNSLTDLAMKNCPGIGEDIIWAFYLERHGWLSTSPLIDPNSQ